MVGHAISPLNLGITTRFAQFLADTSYEALPETVTIAARKGILDWLGCAYAGSTHAKVAALIETLSAIGSPPESLVIGQSKRLGMLDAALANGQMGHMLDYDDTHMSGPDNAVVLHGSSPILPALLALAQSRNVTGRDLMLAYVLGFEIGVRFGQAAPGQHRGGWHLTGTLGSFAAGAASGKLLGLDEIQVVHALGISGTQAAGLQQNRGTDCKSLHAGKAAANGLLAALLAEKGFTSSAEILEGRMGFARTYSATTDFDSALADLGNHWEILRNGYKAYACGIVQHAAIDALVDLSTEIDEPGEMPETVELTVHPHAVSVTGVLEPKTGTQSKFSLHHSAAVAYLDRAAGIAQFSDARAVADDVRELRKRIDVRVDPALRKDEARAIVTVGSARREIHIPHARGTADNPMTDAMVENKFLSNAAPVIGTERATLIAGMIWKLDTMKDAGELISALS